jgi:predicted hotdog family 3-hydroxylacyl-ACP dehydratase
MPEQDPARDNAWIAARIPHRGDMCLLDAVRDWSATHARCSARSHRAIDNPLRHRDRLGAVCAIEYAAQAMAVHAALVAQASGDGAQRPAAGFLTSTRAVQLHVARLDDIEADLDIDVERLSGTSDSVLYGFSVSAAGRLLASGRAAVMLDAARAIPSP